VVPETASKGNRQPLGWDIYFYKVLEIRGANVSILYMQTVKSYMANERGVKI
jgi:hypothetical protein